MPAKAPLRLLSRAPTRIDLAGGTIDLWPLYLFFDQPRTVNLAIDLFAEAELSCAPARSGDGRVALRSGDQTSGTEFAWADLGAYSPPPALELHAKLLRFFAQRHPARGRGLDLAIETRAKSPAGAGLGGSSTLSIALIGALASWSQGELVDVERDGERFIEVTRDVETTVIKVPAGLQDYYGAMYGGLQSLRWGTGSHSRERFAESALREIERRTLLFYSGQSRNSGINNWALFKGCVDGDQTVRARFQEIARAAGELENAIVKGDWAAAAGAIGREWETRRTLAAGISTPAIDRAFAEAATAVAGQAGNSRGSGSGLPATKDQASGFSLSGAPSVAGKVCGAGGGGCFFVYSDALARDPGLKTKVEEAVARSAPDGDIRALPFRAVPRGLTVEVRPSA